jgi:prepilin-type N-terminal cleavage/methylation domain-containing protein
MFKRIRSERGFTLVELLVVLAVLAILIAIVLPNLAGITGGARRTAAETEFDTVQTAMDSMMSKNEAISVYRQGPGAQLDSTDSVVMTYIAGYDPATGTDELGERTVDWTLRSPTHGYYSWDIEGTITMVDYP